MVAINWVFLCDYAYADGLGRASIIRTFSHIRAPQLPFRYPQLFVALEYMADRSEDFTIGAVLSTPSGKIMAKAELKRKGNPEEKGKAQKTFLPLGFYNLLFKESGQYALEILINQNSVHYMPLNVLVPQAPALVDKKKQ